MRLKKPILTAAVIALMIAFPAHAEELQIGCYPKAELMATVKAQKQGMIDQYLRKTPQGDKKTTITGEHNGTGFVHNAPGYILESSDDKTACVLAKTKVMPGEQENQLKVDTVYKLGSKELTSEEWRKVADYAQKNEAKLRADMRREEMSLADTETTLKALEIIGRHGGYPGNVSAKFLYKIDSDGKVIALSRSDF